MRYTTLVGIVPVVNLKHLGYWRVHFDYAVGCLDLMSVCVLAVPVVISHTAAFSHV